MVGAAVTFTTTAGTLTSTGVPVVTDTAGLAPDTLTVSEDGPTEITVTAATRHGRPSRSSCTSISPPSRTPARTRRRNAPVALDGSASTDANSTEGTNDDIASYQWFLGDSLIATGEVTSEAAGRRST